MPRTSTWPLPAPPMPGTLLGAPVPAGRRPHVPAELDDAHRERALSAAAAELTDRYGAAGGLPRDVTRKRRVPYGAAPTKQVRRVFVAKFNPAQSHPTLGRFSASDPATQPQLWDPTGPLECWVSDDLGHTRNTPAHTTISAGDLIFVYRSQPKIDGQVLIGTTDPLAGRPHLLGVWWAVRVHRRRLAHLAARAITDVWHAPLVRFDDPVDVAHIRRHPELQEIVPFTDRTRAALVAASPLEAAALVAACSLPSSVLTASDPVRLAVRLAKIRTGMRPGDLRYARDARARYEYIHAIETAASTRVQGDLTRAGWSVFSRERLPRWGADLDCERPLDGHAPEKRAVEVKGKAGPRWRGVVLQRSQYDRARRSAAAGDGAWWLTICPQALHPAPPPVIEMDAPFVAAHWPIRQVR